jgi:hypothetical protein
VGAGTNRKASGHKGCAAWCALRFNVEVQEPRAFRRKFIDAGRRRAAEYAAPVTAHLAVAEVIHQDKNNVRFTRRSVGGDGLLAIAGWLRTRLCLNRFDRHERDT